MSLPKKLFWVEYRKGDGPSLRYGERGGGKYTSEAEARRRVRELRKRGSEAFLHVADLSWRMVLDDD